MENKEGREDVQRAHPLEGVNRASQQPDRLGVIDHQKHKGAQTCRPIAVSEPSRERGQHDNEAADLAAEAVSGVDVSIHNTASPAAEACRNTTASDAAARSRTALRRNDGSAIACA